MTSNGEVVIDEHSRPSPAPNAGLTTGDEGHFIELPPGRRLLAVNAAGVIIWQSLDGLTDLGAIADDIAAVQGTNRADEIDGLIEFVEQLADHGLLSLDLATEDDPGSAPVDDMAPVDQPAEDVPHGFDVIMEPYPMAADPAGRPTSLDMFLATAPAVPEHRSTFAKIADTLIAALGPWRTVWGMKFDDTGVSWELYFYTHRRDAADTPMSFFERARAAFEQVAGWDAPRSIPENANLVSFEFKPEGTGVSVPRELDVYHRIDGRSEMILAYRLHNDFYRLKNTYEMFPLPDTLDALAARLGSSRYAFPENEAVATDHWISEIESLGSCDLVWCSYKPDRDGVYLGGVEASDLAAFLARYGYPHHLQNWVRDHLDQLDHLRYDIGLDYTVQNGEVRVSKTGFYGYF